MTKTISIVTPVLNEEANLLHCHAAVRDMFDAELPGYDYEHIFADNGSTDTTPEMLRDLAASDPRVKVILNARNFGSTRYAGRAAMRSSPFCPATCKTHPPSSPSSSACGRAGMRSSPAHAERARKHG